jgi:hypothetical protein
MLQQQLQQQQQLESFALKNSDALRSCRRLHYRHSRWNRSEKLYNFYTRETTPTPTNNNNEENK